MSKAKNLKSLCSQLLGESSFMLVDNNKKTTIAGNTDTNKMVIRSDSNANLTKEDVKKILRENAPKKVKQILDTLLIDNFDNIIKASSIIFCESYDFYRTKSINQIAEDYQSLSKENAGKLLSFFSRAGQ